MKPSLQAVLEKLEKLFDAMNDNFFGGELERPVIAVNPDKTNSAYGWITTYRSWHKEGTDGFYEICITAENLNRSIFDISATLLHEMTHLYNMSNGIKDVSRGSTYHNKKFKESAEAHGLLIEHDDKYGWTKTSLHPDTEIWLSSLDLENFGLYRQKEFDVTKVKKKSKSSSRKYVCPWCGLSIRATKEVRITCTDCQQEMECESGEEEET